MAVIEFPIRGRDVRFSNITTTMWSRALLRAGSGHAKPASTVDGCGADRCRVENGGQPWSGRETSVSSAPCAAAEPLFPPP